MLRWIGRLLRRIVVLILAMVGAAVVTLTVLLLIALFVVPVPGFDTGRLPQSMVLALTIDGKLGSSDKEGFIRAFRSGRLGVEEAIGALARAETDASVKGVMLDLSRASPGLAEAQELREAIKRLRAAGKPVIAFADSFGEGASGGPAYYLATAADQIWMQPSGDWSWTGISLENPFFKDMLDKIGVGLDFIQRHEYKGAAEMATRSEFSEPVKRNLTQVVQGWFAQMIKGAAESRKLPEDALRALVDNAPLSSAEALQAKLIDRLGYRGDALDAAGTRDGKAESVALERYFRKKGTPWSQGPVIAVIHGDGEVVRSEGRNFGMPRFSSDRIGKALEQAAEDADVVAIVLRIDSPGGSYVASDALFNHVRRARKSKPIVASLKDVAASGGYFVALAADRILASPATLTGSIGVVGGKVVAADLLKSLGVATDTIEVGAHAGMWHPTRPFTEEERHRVEAMFDRAYLDFTQKLAEARKLSPQEVDAAARGRVWTGEDALKLKLTDGDGGYVAALAMARQLGGLAPDAKVTVEVYPAPKHGWEILRDAIFLGELPEEVETLLRGVRWLSTLMQSMPAGGVQLR